MSAVFTFLRGTESVAIAFDAITTETHTSTAQVTTHPVEEGSNIADGVYLDPKRLSVEAFVTNAPLTTPGSHTRGAKAVVQNGVLQFDSEMDRPCDVYNELADAMDAKSVFTVDTAIKRYTDMVITSMTTPREAGNARWDAASRTTWVGKLTFTIEMQQVRVATSKTGNVQRRPQAGTAKAKVNKGAQGKTEATEKESLLWKGGNALGAY